MTSALIEKPKENKEKQINVLLIEDNEGDSRLVSEYLLENNEYYFNVTCAKSVKEGISLIDYNGAEFFDVFDVILLDLGLPDSLGILTFEKVKSKLSNVPIVVLTGSTLERNDLRHCLELSHQFLIKGHIDSNTLVDAIVRSIEKEKDRERIMKEIYDIRRN